MSATTLLWLVTGCMMLQPLSTDLYLASLPGMALDFGVSPAAVQQTLSLFVFGFGTAQLISGPLSDRYGRRPVLIGGLALYLVSGLACALAPSLGWLIAARFVQAIGCCTAVVVARAIIRDAYTPAEGARVLAKACRCLPGPDSRADPRRLPAGGLRLACRLRRPGAGGPGRVGGFVAPPDRIQQAQLNPMAMRPGQPCPHLSRRGPHPRLLGLRPARFALLCLDLRLHLRHALRPDQGARRADPVLRLPVRLRRPRLPGRHADLPPPDRPHRHRSACWRWAPRSGLPADSASCCWCSPASATGPWW
jgi:hypothetical protein